MPTLGSGVETKGVRVPVLILVFSVPRSFIHVVTVLLSQFRQIDILFLLNPALARARAASCFMAVVSIMLLPCPFWPLASGTLDGACIVASPRGSRGWRGIVRYCVGVSWRGREHSSRRRGGLLTAAGLRKWSRARRPAWLPGIASTVRLTCSRLNLRGFLVLVARQQRNDLVV